MEVAESQETLPAPAAPEGPPGPLQGLARLPIGKQVWLMVALAASVALGVSVVLWTQQPGYAPLYGNMSDKSASDMAAALDEAGIPYRLETGSGALLVPADEVHRARLKLAAAGLPRSADTGFEVLDREQGFGTSQFIERARFQRALEVELARSVRALNPVKDARVHLAVPRQSVFVRNRKRPSASVLVHLHAGRTLDAGQIAAITHLVAASVPNLEASGVSVVDQKGEMLTSRAGSPDAARDLRQLDYVRRVEGDIVDRIYEILRPITGREAVRAQVTADMDFTRVEQTRESFNPDLPALRSERVIEQRGSGPDAIGIPGALSNQPPGAASVPEQANAQPPAGQGSADKRPFRKSATRNYEIDKTISHTMMPTTSLRRLSVAVVVDDHREVGPDGEPLRRPLTPEEIDRIEGLVKEAVGYDARRGDRVNVTNVSFTGGLSDEPLPEPPLWEQQWVWDLAKQAAGVLLVLLLVLGVLRPAMRNLTGQEVRARELEAQAAGALPAPEGEGAGEGAEGLAEDQVRISGEAEGVPRLTEGDEHEQRLEAIQRVFAEDPRRVAQVLRNWLTTDE